MPRRRVIKSKRKTVLRITALFGGLILIAGAAAGVYAFINRTPKNPIARLNELPFTGDFVYTGNGFFYQKDGMIQYDDSTNEKNSYSVQTGQGEFMLAGSPKIQLIYNNKEFQIIGQSYPTEIYGTIRSLKCGKDFIAALRADGDANETERIQLFDSTGATLFDQLGTDQFIIDYGFFEADSEYLYIISMSLIGATPVSTITLYNATRISTSGVIPVQSQMIERLCFTKQSIFAIGTNQIIRYSLSDNRESYRSTVYGWKLMDFDTSGTNALFLLRPRKGEALSIVKLISLGDASVAGETSRLLQLPPGAIDAYLFGGKIIAIYPDRYISYDLTGKQSGVFEFSSQIDSAKKLDNGLLLLSLGPARYTLKIS